MNTLTERETSTDAWLHQLLRFDTPTICNVIELFGVRPQTEGYMDERIRACFPQFPPMAGYAVTATFRSAAPPRKGGSYGSLDEHLKALIAAPKPAIIVFQDLDDPPKAATFGEVMCTAYKAFGAAGLITSGAGRDLLQVEAMQFPVFTSGAICSHGYPQIIDIDIPVHVGGLTVHPGDLLHADANGVTNIPHEIAEAVARLCPRFIEAEAVMIDHLRDGSPTIETFAARRRQAEEMMRLLAQEAAAFTRNSEARKAHRG